jgi:UPF0716 protein FxsA
MKKWIFLVLMLYAAAEIALLIELGNWLGLGWVMAWVAGTVLLGMGVLRTQGVWALRRIARQLQQEILPTKELVDLALVMMAGILLISPGIIADLVGLFLFIPLGRVGVRAILLQLLPRWIPEEVPDARLRAAASNVIEIERDPHG